MTDKRSTMKRLLDKFTWDFGCAVLWYLCAKLTPDCRHVLVRTFKHDVRCHNPTFGNCQFFYCIEHCRALCNCEDYSTDDGDDGDEDDIEPFVWKPKKDEVGKEVVQS